MRRPKKQSSITSNNSENPDIDLGANTVIPDLEIKIDELTDNYNAEKNEEDEKKRTGKQYREAKKKKDLEEKEKEAYRESFTGLGKTLITLICDRLPNPKPLTEQELTQFDNAFTSVSLKYMSVLGKYQEESALLLIAVFIILPRTNFLDKPEKEIKVNGQ